VLKALRLKSDEGSTWF